MRITRIEIRTVSIPFKKPYITSRAIQTSVDHVIVTIYTDEGIIGYGEGAPSKNMLEFPMDAIALCLENYLAPALIGLDPRNMAKLHSTMDETMVANVYAKAALDIAAYDVAGKSLGVPVYTLLGGCYRSRIPLTKSIGMNIPEDPEKIRSEAAEIAKQGWRVVKLKGSGNPDEDILRVKAAREGIEEAKARVPIRIDPNCGYTGADVALRAFRVMETFNLDLIEQPLPRWDFQGMTELCRALDTPIMVDESLVTIRDAATIFRQKVADVLNVKQQKAGGLYRALQIAGLAECANLPVVIGALHDTGISQSASVHLAAACPTLRYPCDLRTPLSQAESVIRDPLIIEDGEIICPEKPGLGIEVDEAVLDKYTLQKVVVKG